MENPATHGKAEKIVSKVLDDFFENQQRAITDPVFVLFGPSLERRITDALRKEGLLAEEDHVPHTG